MRPWIRFGWARRTGALRPSLRLKLLLPVIGGAVLLIAIIGFIFISTRNACRRWLGSLTKAQGQSANPRYPHHRAVRACARRRARKGARGGVQRVRHQADRVRSAGRNRSAHRRQSEMTPSESAPPNRRLIIASGANLIGFR